MPKAPLPNPNIGFLKVLPPDLTGEVRVGFVYPLFGLIVYYGDVL
jgi:hypothetical protein